MENLNDQTKQFQACLSRRQVAEIQLSSKTNVPPSRRPKIACSKDTYKILIDNWDKAKIEFVEQFKGLLISRANKVLGFFDVSSGWCTATIADPELIFAAAIKTNACSLIGSHNHPSGNLKPSEADFKLN